MVEIKVANPPTSLMFKDLQYGDVFVCEDEPTELFEKSRSNGGIRCFVTGRNVSTFASCDPLRPVRQVKSLTIELK